MDLDRMRDVVCSGRTPSSTRAAAELGIMRPAFGRPVELLETSPGAAQIGGRTTPERLSSAGRCACRP